LKDQSVHEPESADLSSSVGNSKISVRGLVKIFGPHSKKVLPLLRDGLSKEQLFEKTRHAVGVYEATFSVRPGEVFVLMGLSGSGKSTLLRCLNRLIEPTAGEILIDGEDIVRVDEKRLRGLRRQRLGMVFQRFALFPHRSVIGNVAYGLEVQGLSLTERHEKANAVLEMVGLKEWADSYPHELSGGMQQRVGLARALASDPDILLMDEAFSALDPLIRRDMQNELLSLQSQVNKTIIFVTHDLDEALKIGDRIALMKDGVIVQIGTPEEILTKPADEYVRRFVEDVDMAKVLTADAIMKSAETVPIKDGPRVALRRMKELGISSIFVVTRERKLAGIVTAEDAVQAREENIEDLSRILVPDPPTALLNTPISDLIPVLADSKYPVAVVNQDGRLVGVIVRGALLAGLTRRGD
jgi:glycine betaine/proline transport system ATP-binding protein